MRWTALLVLGGCGTVAVDGGTVDLSLSWPGGRVIDPKLGPGPDGDPALRLEVGEQGAPEGGDCALLAQITGRDGAVWTATDALSGGVALRWDGRGDDGLPFDPGPAAVTVWAECGGVSVGLVEDEVFVVRLGLSTVNLGEHPDGGYAELAYHKLSLWESGITRLSDDLPEWRIAAVDAPADLDDDGGAARTLPAPWENPDVPPWGVGDPEAGAYSVPAAYVAGSTARVTVTAGSGGVSARTGAVVRALGPAGEGLSDAPALRLVSDDATAADDADDAAVYTPGQTLEFDLAAPSVLGRRDLAVSWRWEAWDEGAGAWVGVPGALETTHRVYALAGAPALRDGVEVDAAPAVAWVGVLDEIDGAIAGLDPDTPAVLDALRDYLHYNDWLFYDPSDSDYTDYEGSYIYWQYISADLSGWLDRDNGLSLYCHSVSCLLSTLAGHAGVEAPQQVLGVGFYTNLTRAAGSESWKHWSFNSHSVVSPDGGESIWDAGVALDGDDDPYSEPVTEIEPKGMSGEEYFWRLTYDDISIVNDGLCYFY